jgi:hypothetical protein
MSDIQTVAALGNYDARPPVGTEWEVTDFGSSAWVGVAPAAVPEINVGIYDGVLGPSWILQSTDIRGWYRRQRLFINNANYLRLNNPNGGAARNLSFSAKVARIFGTNPTVVITDLQNVGAGANWDIQPAAGVEYEITDVGASVWVGGAPFNQPDMTVSIYNGAIAAAVMLGAEARGWGKPLSIHINNTDYLRLTNTNVGANVLSVVGKISRIYGTGATVVRTDVQAIGAGANWDVRPPLGQEWKVTEFGSGTWVGVSPAGIPQITVSLYDGALASVLMQSTDNKGWFDELEILIDNVNYLRINDASGAGQNIACSAVLTRQFQS